LVSHWVIQDKPFSARQVVSLRAESVYMNMEYTSDHGLIMNNEYGCEREMLLLMLVYPVGSNGSLYHIE
jgi:hypothetical protein